MPPALGPAEVTVLDLPDIDGSDPAVLTRLAVFARPWPGAMTLWRSVDGGASFVRAATVEAPATLGRTLDSLAAGPAGRWDKASRMRVRLAGGSLATVNDARVLDGANAAAVQGTDGRWEVLQFAHAELVDSNTFLLSRLLRGQAGSEYAIADPLPAGAPFVLLDQYLVPIASGVGALDRPVQLRVVAAGRGLDDASAVAVTLTPQPTALRPLAPVHVTAQRVPEGVHIGWIRRTRIDGDGWGAEVPLGEATEAYSVEILSGGIVLRTLAATTPQALYAAADELADFGAVQTTLHLRVAQISSSVGAGTPVDIVLAV
jgi:hypothetical protein